MFFSNNTDQRKVSRLVISHTCFLVQVSFLNSKKYLPFVCRKQISVYMLFFGNSGQMEDTLHIITLVSLLIQAFLFVCLFLRTICHVV